MWLNGGTLAIGLGRALMRRRDVAIPTILNPSHANVSLGCIVLVFKAFGLLWTVSSGAFPVDEAGSQGHFPPSNVSWLEGLAAPAPWKFLSMALFCMMVRFLHCYCRNGAVSYGRKEISQSSSSETKAVRYSSCLEDVHWSWTSGWRTLLLITVEPCLQSSRWLASECDEHPSVLWHDRYRGLRI